MRREGRKKVGGREGRPPGQALGGAASFPPAPGPCPSHCPRLSPTPVPAQWGRRAQHVASARAGQRHGCARCGQWRHWTLGLLPAFLPSQMRRGTKGSGRPRPGAPTPCSGATGRLHLAPPGRRPRGCQDRGQRCSGAQGGGLVPPSPPDQLRSPSSSPASRAVWTLSRSRSHGPHLDLQWRQAQRGGWGRERPQARGGCSRPWGRARRGGATESLQTSLIVV